MQTIIVNYSQLILSLTLPEMALFILSGYMSIRKLKTFSGNQDTKKTTVMLKIIMLVRRRFSLFSACWL